MPNYALGIDVGSTTIKLALFCEGELVYSIYRRHKSNVRGELEACLKELSEKIPGIKAKVAVTGSGGLSIASSLGLNFVQEVMAGTHAAAFYIPNTDVIIELGGEDAKLTFLKPVLEQRMNGTCAGGTGSFIDQMAMLLKTDADGLNELSKNSTASYQIASRCGVFAKSDLQPLLNEGAKREDLASSVLQAVVNQTIAGLAQGRQISGNIVFLGGPLSFLSELRRLFIKTIGEKGNTFTAPENAGLFVAIGAAMLASGEDRDISELALAVRGSDYIKEISRMRPLFIDDKEKNDFYLRHKKNNVKRGGLKKASGPLYLGFDAGSTTIKAALISDKKELLYTFYSSNASDPVSMAIKILKEIYSLMPHKAYISSVCVTGYGEALLKNAFNADFGEIETVAHFTAARHFCPEADFVIDIGGQDMKCMSIKDKTIQNVMLNEACSSGCGSFIETFAGSLGLSAKDFADEALFSKSPVDLGTRCTVFMNSRVKQAQKEGACIGDISAGLCYSVVRNAIYKVIKLRDPSMLGQKVVVQGGTFKSDAILRCFELVSGCEVIRPDIAELMGAFGSALIALERSEKGKSSLISAGELESFKTQSKPAVCNRCENHCKLMVMTFPGGRRFVSGNRCESGALTSKNALKNELPNLFSYKYNRVFDYTPIEPEMAPRGVIGIPRVLNMYENYPFWFTFFTKLGFSVKLSGKSDHELFRLGMETIPSESVCYPAKLVHGHIAQLIKEGVKTIFYPSIPYEKREYTGADNHYNCPIVTSYPETIANNMENISKNGVLFLHPFLNLNDLKSLKKGLCNTFKDISKKEITAAVMLGQKEQLRFREDVTKEGEKALAYIQKKGINAVVLAGRPYHIDPEINHGIPDMITGLGLAVLTEDSIAHKGHLRRPIRAVDQWAYHTRLYEAAAFVSKTPYLELVQLNSFGCGLDAVTSDQVNELLKDRLYTLLKIDEISNLGAARIRIRSLAAAINTRKNQIKGKEPKPYKKAVFTKEMSKRHTIIGPQMSPIHFEFLETAFISAGYNFKILEKAEAEDIETGLRFVNNDACYPSIMVVGQLINAFLSGKYDPDNSSVIITQTGGGCRATNYIAFLRQGLREAGFSHIPVISLNMAGLEGQPGMKYTPRLLDRLVKAVVFGDLFLNIVLRTRPYERIKGSSDALHRKWAGEVHKYLRGGSVYSYKRLINKIVCEFEALDINSDIKKTRVGLVGEILVKFHPDANNDAVRVVEAEGGEAVMPGLLDFVLYTVYSNDFKYKHLGHSLRSKLISEAAIILFEAYRAPMVKALRRSSRFVPPKSIKEIGKGAEQILSLGNSTGEGWFLTGEMVELIEQGVPNIICMQPFACLPNHVTGKGMIKELRRRFPNSNIVPVDYDPGASEVNQLNRIKLMLSAAK